MKKLLLFLALSPCFIMAQQAPELCQGHYWTEEQGAAFLKKQETQYQSWSDWQKRAETIKAQIRAGAGLEKLSKAPKTKLIRHSLRQMDGYTVENVAFQSIKGYYVTGNLYRPSGVTGPFAAILCPHGHWDNPPGRMSEQMQMRCGNLARMGAVVLSVDMIGYGDSKQTQHKIPDAFTIQTISNIRALDFLLAQPDIDLERVAVTGASGGGTQTFMLTALDDRVKVSVPTVMVSAHFFGGCVCESGKPVHKKGDYQTNNVEIAACAAPRPMMLISDGGDWTKNNPQVEFPFVRWIYSLAGKPYLVENAHFPEEGHDYGPNKRAAMYGFLVKHLNLDWSKIAPNGKVDESHVKVLSPAELAVFDEAHPRPKKAKMGDEKVASLLK